MISLIEQERQTLIDLCRQFQVERLDLFGSATVPSRFNAVSSDLDFLVTFANMPPIDYANAHLGMLLRLEDIFKRPVDLVTEKSIRNPYFLPAINATRQSIYDRSRQETTV
jgi:uncharacterized protein